jgi:hypothetical protein
MADLSHSPLGASSSERWIACPGSVTFIDKMRALQAEGIAAQDDDPEYRREGTAAHAVAASCLQSGADAWEFAGQTVEGVSVTEEMTDAVQDYFDICRADDLGRDASVEARIGGVDRPHPLFYGTVDWALILPGKIIVADFKYGQGVVVEPEWNPQLLYYAYGILRGFRGLPSDHEVVIRIVQPRTPVGAPIREWVTSVGEVLAWGEQELIPAMNRTEVDHTLDAGDHCRFCPAKLVCPMMTALFGAAMQADPVVIPKIDDATLGRSYQYVQAVERYLKALEDEMFKRLMTGRAIEGVKLVDKRSRRVFRDTVAISGPDGEEMPTKIEDAVSRRFGEDGFKREVKSPAEIEKLGGAGKAFVKEYAFFPHTGLTVALASDKREAAKVQSTADAFGAAVAAVNEQEKAHE